MQALLRWTIETIRNDETMMSWLEERKSDWVPLVRNTIQHLLEGSAVIMVTDGERDWFMHYVMQNVNRPGRGRPILPFYSLKSIYPQYESIKTDEDLELVNDMLNISFRYGHIFWYIGKPGNPNVNIALRRDDSFLWALDEEFQNSFWLSSTDELLDFKLFQLYRIFDKTIDAALFGQTPLDE